MLERLGRSSDFFRGKRFKSDRVEAFYGDWMVTLDNFIVDKMVFTRIRAPYINRDDFTFKIYREHAGHRISLQSKLTFIFV